MDQEWVSHTTLKGSFKPGFQMVPSLKLLEANYSFLRESMGLAMAALID